VLNKDVAEAAFEDAPNMDGAGAFSSATFCWGMASSMSSMASVGGLCLLGAETISSNDEPNENKPEVFSGLGASLTAVPSPLKVDPSTKPPEPAPKAPFESSVF
jgi:hypothetical protein